MVVRLINEHDRHLARQRVDENGFTFEEDYDLLFGKFEDSELVATAATREGKKKSQRHGNLYDKKLVAPAAIKTAGAG